MKRFVLAMLLLSPVPAFAADLSPEPAEPAPAVVTPYNWTGFYVGAHIGYGWGREHDTLKNTTLAEAMDRFNVNGVLGGIHGGYNQQFDSNFVVGLEADADLSGIQGDDHTAQAGGASRLDMRNRWQSSIRARVGYAFDRFLVYATGGMAIGDIYASVGPFLTAPLPAPRPKRALAGPQAQASSMPSTIIGSVARRFAIPILANRTLR